MVGTRRIRPRASVGIDVVFSNKLGRRRDLTFVSSDSPHEILLLLFLLVNCPTLAAPRQPTQVHEGADGAPSESNPSALTTQTPSSRGGSRHSLRV